MYYFLILIFDIFIFQNCISRILPQILLFEEIFTIILFILTICVVLRKNKIRVLLRERKAMIFFILFIISGIISSILFNGNINKVGIMKDILAVSKPYITLFSIIILTSSIDREKLLRVISKRARLYILVMFIFCIINIFVDIGLGHGYRFGVRVYKFLYTHPTYLVFSIVILICILISENEKKNKIYIWSACIILISTCRSKAFVFVITYFLINIYLKFNKKIKIKYFIVLLLLGMIITHEKILDYFSYGITAARPALYIIGLKIMLDYFPFGSGYCTFGSGLSGEFYSPLYEYYNINLVSGLTINDFSYMADTFWPYIYGQFGLVGFILYGLLLWNVYKGFRQRYSYSKNKIKAVDLLFFYLLFASVAEAVFIDVTGQFAFFVLAVFMGNYNKYSINKNNC